MTDDLTARLQAAWRLVSQGKSPQAVVEARTIRGLAPENPIIASNCAGIFIDAGERLRDLAMVQEGVQILDQVLSDDRLLPEERTPVRYNLANGKAVLLKLRSAETGLADEVRDMREEEEVVALYYDSSDSLRSATPEQVINCAGMLRIESRVHEAIDLLDYVLCSHPDHPNAHASMGQMLWAALAQVGWRDDMPQALLIPALVHFERAAAGFDDRGEPVFAERVRTEAKRLRELADRLLLFDVDAAVADIGEGRLGAGDRLGAPLGLRLLARSPYRDEDDLWLAEDLDSGLQHIVADAAGTFAVGRTLLRDAASIDVRMPRWGQHTPDAGQHLLHGAVRQFWSVLEKVAWLVNEAFELGLSDNGCGFAAVFRPPSKAVKEEFGLPTKSGSVRFHPNLQRANPGLRALAGLSCAFDARTNTAVYVPLKRLRHSVVHRVPDQPTSVDDAAFLMGIARGALLHGVDALINQSLASS